MNTRLAAIVAALAIAAASANARPTVVHRNVHRALAATGKVDLIVTMKTDTKVAMSAQEASYENRGAAIAALKNQLEAAHGKALAPLASLFAQESTSDVSIKTYWISPVASIENATVDVVEKIAALPNVLSIREAEILSIPEPIRGTNLNATTNTGQGYEWGVIKIYAPDVWTESNIGQDIHVGSIDTGVRGTHEALAPAFGGAYSWFDPENKKPKPYDDNGHGTHTMGTIAGINGIGVAPGATWMSCRGCRGRTCYEVDLLACAQFMLCPTDTNGNNPDCSKAPRVINNSWGGGQGQVWYSDAIAAWVKAGIVPVFSNGNSGPLCGSANSPADNPLAIAVGATTSADELSSFSSKGPTVNGLIKPDLSAPGSDVRSSVPTSDTAYDVYSGTSMAAPHVTGAIALILQADPTLTVAQVRARLTRTTVQSGLVPTGMTCGGTTDTTWPNNQFGYGRLNAYDAAQGVRSQFPACAGAAGRACGSDATGPGCCSVGEYCQPWNPWYYQCRPVAAMCAPPTVGTAIIGDDIAVIKDILPWDCCDRCAATSGCLAYTFVNYNADGHAACYLKRGGLPRDQFGAVSAVIRNFKP